MKTTIVIPCAKYHLWILDRTLTSIISGTRIPDEVIIAVSPIEADSQHEIIERLQGKFGKFFRLVIIKESRKLLHAEARNFPIKFIQGGLVLYHDADDTQHPQRIEIVQRFFNEYDIVHLCHSYRYSGEGQAGKIDYNTIRVIPTEKLIERYSGKNWEEIRAFGSPFMRTHVGACCVRKRVLDKVKWPGLYPGEDLRFCLNVLQKFKKTILIDAPLYNYNTSDSRRK